MAIAAATLVLVGPYKLSWASHLQIWTIASTSVLVVFFKAARNRKTFHIDISGIGQIRLTQYSGVSASHDNSGFALDGGSGQVVHLSADSVLWPRFLLLRLMPDRGAVISIPVLPDSLGGSGFAGLSVACRYIAARDPNGKIFD